MKNHEVLSKACFEELTRSIIGCAIYVHHQFGPGLFESVNEAAMKEELRYKNLNFEAQKRVKISYREIELETELRCDIVVEKLVICAIKAVESLLPVHHAQMLSYMRLSGIPKGLLPNFHSATMQPGIKSFVSQSYSLMPD